MVQYINDASFLRRLIIMKTVDENIQHPFTRMSKGPDPRRVEDFGDEVPAEETPCRAVAGAGNDALVTGDQLDGGLSWRTVGEDGATLD